jgi:hypothetical protein
MEVENITDLPLGKNDIGNNDMTLSNLFAVTDELETNSKFKNELMLLTCSVILFILVSLPKVRSFIFKNTNSEYITLLLQAVLFTFIYYVISNTYLKV